MSARILDGKALAASLQSDLKAKIAQSGITPGLAVINVGDNPASAIYVNKKHQACEAVGIRSWLHKLAHDTTEEALLALIDQLNRDTDINGILVQLPLPAHIDTNLVLTHIDPRKDVDGFHPQNIGLLTQGKPGLRPCTPAGIMALLATIQAYDLTGKHAVVVGASKIVGRPLALELLRANCTVTICHIHTQDLASHVRQADILAVAIGCPGVIQSEWIKPGAAVIDVGINRQADGKIVGDIEFDSASQRASWITPVPGGVGPMTVTMLLQNTALAKSGDGSFKLSTNDINSDGYRE